MSSRDEPAATATTPLLKAAASSGNGGAAEHAENDGLEGYDSGKNGGMRRIPSLRDLRDGLHTKPVLSEEQIAYQKNFPNVIDYVDETGQKRVYLPLIKKLLFGLPGNGIRVIECFRNAALKKYYVDEVFLPLWWIGFMEVGAVGLDAITQPVVAQLGDSTRSKYGRRRPYFTVGCAFVAAFFTMLWMPCYIFNCDRANGDCQGVGTKGIFVGIMYCLFYLAMDFTNGPYEALGPELTPDYDDRTSLYSWQAIFNVAGRGLGVIMPGVMLMFWPKSQGFVLLAAVAGIWYVCCCWCAGSGLDEQVVPHIGTTAPLVPSLRHCYHNSCFRILFWMHVVEQIGESAQWTMLPFVVDNLVEPTTMTHPMSSETLYSILGAFMMIAQALSIPIWRHLGRHLGKYWTYFLFHVLLVVSTAAKYSVAKHDLVSAIVPTMIWGAVMGGGSFLHRALMNDVIDYDTLRTGERREAQYAAFYDFVPKLVQIPGTVVPLVLLSQYGYQPGQDGQSEHVLAIIRHSFSTIPAFFCLLATTVLLLYPAKDDEIFHSKVQSGIADHKKSKACQDPITKMRLPDASEAD
eukprot:SAG11_NODE_4049_length_2086_cov_2.756920_1_plen_574_part_10